MPSRRALILVGALALLCAAVAAYVVGERACPPPAWAFWKLTEGAGGRSNFACVVGR